MVFRYFISSLHRSSLEGPIGNALETILEKATRVVCTPGEIGTPQRAPYFLFILKVQPVPLYSMLRGRTTSI